MAARRDSNGTTSFARACSTVFPASDDRGLAPGHRKDEDRELSATPCALGSMPASHCASLDEALACGRGRLSNRIGFVHARRTPGRHRLQPRGIRDIVARASTRRRRRSADRGIVLAEGIRDGGGRDRQDNCVIVCSIEKLDDGGTPGTRSRWAPRRPDRTRIPAHGNGVDRGAQVGVEGGLQRAVALNTRDGRMFGIEMNPRVSRRRRSHRGDWLSDAKVAAKLAVGYRGRAQERDHRGPRPRRSTGDRYVSRRSAVHLRDIPGANTG